MPAPLLPPPWSLLHSRLAFIKSRWQSGAFPLLTTTGPGFVTLSAADSTRVDAVGGTGRCGKGCKLMHRGGGGRGDAVGHRKCIYLQWSVSAFHPASVWTDSSSICSRRSSAASRHPERASAMPSVRFYEARSRALRERRSTGEE